MANVHDTRVGVSRLLPQCSRVGLVRKRCLSFVFHRIINVEPLPKACCQSNLVLSNFPVISSALLIMYLSYYILPGLAILACSSAFPNQDRHRHSTVALAPTAIGGGSSNPPPSVATAGSSPSSTSPDGAAGSSVCDATSTVSDNGYTIMANTWGASSGVSGSQCARGEGTSGSGIAWTTTWNWNGGTNVKSFANANGNSLTPCKAVGEIASIPSSWAWR